MFGGHRFRWTGKNCMGKENIEEAQAATHEKKFPERKNIPGGWDSKKGYSIATYTKGVGSGTPQVGTDGWFLIPKRRDTIIEGEMGTRKCY